MHQYLRTTGVLPLYGGSTHVYSPGRLPLGIPRTALSLPSAGATRLKANLSPTASSRLPLPFLPQSIEYFLGRLQTRINPKSSLPMRKRLR